MEDLSRQSRAQDRWADVRAYGAVGDGVADDTAAIQAAIDTDLAVYFPSGRYLISSALLLSEVGQVFWGNGDTSIIDLGSSAIAAFKLDRSSPAPATRVQHVLEDLLIEGDDATAGQRVIDYKDGGAGFASTCRPVLNRVNCRGVECYFYDRGCAIATITNCIAFLTVSANGFFCDGNVLPSATQLLLRGVYCDHDENYAATTGGFNNKPFVNMVDCGFAIANGASFHGINAAQTVFYSAVGTNKKVTSDDTETKYVACTFSQATYIEINAPSQQVIGCLFGSAGQVLTRCVDILATGTGAVIQGNKFGGVSVTGTYVIEGVWTTEAVRNAASDCVFSGNYACKVTETGAADNNKYVGIDEDSTVIGPASAIEGEDVFQGRIQRDSTTQISLQRYKGKETFVRGAKVGIPAAGIALLTTDNRIDNTGADAGAAMAVNTEYYIYRSNSKASFAPSDLRASATSPTVVRGQKYLGASDNAYNWRYVGRVRTISNGGTPNFADSLTQRLVVNEHNKLDLAMLTVPGYVDDNAQTSFNEAPAAGPVAINGGVGSQLAFIADGETPIRVLAKISAVVTDSTNDGFTIGVGFDSQTIAREINYSNYDGAGKALTDEKAYVEDVIPPDVATAGYHTLDFLVWNYAPVNNLSIVADYGRGGGAGGAPADVRATYMTLILKG